MAIMLYMTAMHTCRGREEDFENEFTEIEEA